jgi:hypothetical protein
MPFIEITGQTLLEVVNEGEIDIHELHRVGVHGDSILRVNEHGEIELRFREGWTMVGGLIGNYQERLREVTGLEYAE